MIETDEHNLIETINEKIASGEFPAGIRPYGEVKKSSCAEEIEKYGRYYLWDNYANHLMAADVSLDRLIKLAGLASNDDKVSSAA